MEIHNKKINLNKNALSVFGRDMTASVFGRLGFHRHSPAQIIFKQGERDMGDKGKRDKGKREQQKKAQLNPKEKRKLKKEKKK
jgi:hypothetical protein